MGMVDEGLTPGMQDGEEADLGAEVLRVCADRAQGLGRCGEENVVDHGLVLICDGPDLFG